LKISNHDNVEVENFNFLSNSLGVFLNKGVTAIKNCQNWKSGNLGSFPSTREYGEFPKYIGIWRIPQIPGILENSSNLRVVFFQFKKISQMPSYLGNSPGSKALEEFSRFPDF